jgi:hypothetical protein
LPFTNWCQKSRLKFLYVKPVARQNIPLALIFRALSRKVASHRFNVTHERGKIKERMTLYDCHFPWPGVGHVAKEKDGFRYFPEATKWVSK